MLISIPQFRGSCREVKLRTGSAIVTARASGCLHGGLAFCLLHCLCSSSALLFALFFHGCIIFSFICLLLRLVLITATPRRR